MILDVRRIANALGGDVSGPDAVLAPGPGHSAADRSLSIKLDAKAPDGFLVHSFSSDDPIVCRDYVRERVGLPAFKPNGNAAVPRTRPRVRISQELLESKLVATVSAQGCESKPKGKISETYDYTDANGTLLYQVVRYVPKDFKQRRPDGKGSWIWKLEKQRVLYRWPELLKFPDATIFFCEGEKDADRVASLDRCATTIASGTWTDECVKPLAGRDVIILEDKKNGHERAFEAAEALHGTAKTIRIVLLPDIPEGKNDVSDWLDADPRHDADKLDEVCIAAPLWTPETSSVATDNAAAASADSKPATDLLPLPFINIAAWQDQAVPEREWIIRDRIPRNNVTLLSGEGAIGKSILSLQLATAVALGRDWLGALPDPGPVIAVYCEDDECELWRRLDNVFEHYGAAYTEFTNMHLTDLTGGETLMAVPDRNGLIQSTKLFGRISQAACDIKPRLIVLDNAADVYGGNENDRAQVRQFIGLLRGLAIRAGAGVLLTSHPSLTGISSGTGLSGSTAWNASVRSRLYFKRAKTDKDEEPDPDLRVLEVMKSNYGPVGEAINLRWTKGLFLPVESVSNLDKLAAEQAVDLLFLELLDKFNGQGRNTCEKPAAHNYAPSLFAKEASAQEQHTTKTNFENAMRRLFDANKIQLEPYGPPSKGFKRLARK